jgi:hypothetical protein
MTTAIVADIGLPDTSGETVIAALAAKIGNMGF